MSMYGQARRSVTGTVVDTVWEIVRDIEVRMLAPGVWLHTSYYTFPGNVRVPSNGLIVQSGDSLLIVDSAWGAVDTALGRFDRGAIRPTRLGGPDHAFALRSNRRNDRVSAPWRTGSGAPIDPPPRQRARSPSAGHTERDRGTGNGEALRICRGIPRRTRSLCGNLMVWIPDAGVLFGGCAVRAASATSLGNVAHADLTRWPGTLRRTQERYGAARIVIPGHGDPGDTGLLAHTLSLFSR
jgi:hypothetical protein